MARMPSPPPFPDRPGAWLANFRYRSRAGDGHHLSPELLGYHLGVSGATVRRWECGRSDPSEDDLRRFATVCQLSSLQREFLLRAYGRAHARAEGPPSDFHARATRLLSLPRPAFVVDELFYVRAWNSYIAAVLERSPLCMKEGTHVMQIVLMQRQGYDPDLQLERSRNMVRRFWLWTAEQCALDSYAAMLRRLSANRLFRECWLSLADPVDNEDLVPFAATFDDAVVCGRRYRIYAMDAVFPPAYRAYVYEPADDGARALLCRLEQTEAPRVSFANRIHWSQDREVPAGDACNSEEAKTARGRIASPDEAGTARRFA